MRRVAAKKGYEAYINYDASGGLWEVFTDTDCVGYIGCADSREDAVRVGRDWVAEQCEEYNFAAESAQHDRESGNYF
jgi:hypothetical protein